MAAEKPCRWIAVNIETKICRPLEAAGILIR